MKVTYDQQRLAIARLDVILEALAELTPPGVVVIEEWQRSLYMRWLSELRDLVEEL